MVRNSCVDVIMNCFNTFHCRRQENCDDNYFTCHIGQHQQPKLDNGEINGPELQQSSTGFSNRNGKRQVPTEVFDIDENCNSPIGRLDVWSDHRRGSYDSEISSKENSSLVQAARVRHRSESLVSDRSTKIAVPPPLDILKKRASASATNQDQYASPTRDTNKDSNGNISSPKSFGSGTLFSASLGFLGSPDHLRNVNANM